MPQAYDCLTAAWKLLLGSLSAPSFCPVSGFRGGDVTPNGKGPLPLMRLSRIFESTTSFALNSGCLNHEISFGLSAPSVQIKPLCTFVVCVVIKGLRRPP